MRACVWSSSEKCAALQYVCAYVRVCARACMRACVLETASTVSQQRRTLSTENVVMSCCGGGLTTAAAPCATVGLFRTCGVSTAVALSHTCTAALRCARPPLHATALRGRRQRHIAVSETAQSGAIVCSKA